MDSAQVLSIGRELLLTALLLTMPTVVISMVVGILISVVQTVTSIQEQTLAFAPRILAVGIGLVVTMPWSLRVLSSFTYRMLWHAAQAGS